MHAAVQYGTEKGDLWVRLRDSTVLIVCTPDQQRLDAHLAGLPVDFPGQFVLEVLDWARFIDSIYGPKSS